MSTTRFDKRIDQLTPSGLPLDGNDLFAIYNANGTRNETLGRIKDYIANSISGLTSANSYLTGATLNLTTLELTRNEGLPILNVDLSALGNTGSTLVPLIYNQSTTEPNNSIQPSFGTSSLSSGSTFSGILGGNGNTITDSRHSSIVGGNNNYVSSPYLNATYRGSSSIGGGTDNRIGSYTPTNTGLTSTYTAQNNVIGGGKGNKIEGTVDWYPNIIGGGYNNTISRNELDPNGSPSLSYVGGNTIGGGYGNSTHGYWGTIGGGGENVLNPTWGPSIGGGITNTIGKNDLSSSYLSLCATIGGGMENAIGDPNFNISGLLITPPFGSSNAFSSIGGGRRNVIYLSRSSSIGGGELNKIIYSSDELGGYNFIGGGLTNLLSSGTSKTFIGGGENNTLVTSDFSSIVGGENNYISGDNSFIGGGYNNTTSDNTSSIVGGSGNNINTSINTTIVGGLNNEINLGLIQHVGRPDGLLGHNVIAGGYANRMESGGISGGNFIGSGENNFMNDYSFWSSIVGGNRNSMTNSYVSSIGGGDSNIMINGNYSSIGGGVQNTITGSSYSSIIGGQNNIILSGFNNTHIIGSNITSVNADTAHVERFNIGTVDTGSTATDLLVRESDGMVNTVLLSSVTQQKYAADISFTGATVQTITHNLNDTDIIVQLKDSTGEFFIPDIVNNYTTNSVDIQISSTETCRVIIVG